MADKLLYIYYKDAQDVSTVNEYLELVERLSELVEVQQINAIITEKPNAMYIDENRIHIRPDWFEVRPAFVFPSIIPFNKNNFLGIVFGFLGNEEKYPQYLYANPDLLYLFDLMQAILKGEIADNVMESILKRTKFAHPFENYVFNHNVAIALNYAQFSSLIDPDAIDAHYKDALELAFEPAYKAYTLKYYATFLIDNNAVEQALDVLNKQVPKNLADYPKFSLKRLWCQAQLKQISFPFDTKLLTELKEMLWETLQFFDKNGHKIIAGFLWMDAATIANLCNSYTESLSYINKAIAYFKSEGQVEMTAQAQLIAGGLFYDWAQSGNPQFYKSALEAYQEALKVFKRDEAPQVFADIHHQLGIIYAELPAENKKRSIWAALSATSFNEALNYFNKVEQPYGYAMVCNSFANAYTKYPKGGRSDNFEKALWFYNEALSIRSATEFPVERAITLINYLEASWKVGNPEGGFNVERYNDMLAKANEIKMLTEDEQLIEEANKHLELLLQLENELR